MTTSEWISVIALIISSGGFALQARGWLMSGPRLHLSVIADAMSIPDDGKGIRLALTVINRGDEPTMLTHMVGFVFPSWWRKYRNNPEYAGVVNSPTIPYKLDINATWMGMLMYDKKLTDAREKGKLYVGVIASHSDGNHLIRVPRPKKDDVPKNKIASGS
jgi:hypothetical protein